MKKVFKSFLVVGLLVIAVLALSACAPVDANADQGINPPTALAQGLVGLPDEAQTLILAFVTAGVAWLLLKINMGQYTQALAAVIAPMIVTFFESLLMTIPPVFDNLVLSIIHILVLLLSGSLGAFLFVRRVQTPKRLMAD